MTETLVETRELVKHFPERGNFLGRLLGRERVVVRAADGVSIRISEHETLGLVGESGSGKTTFGRTLILLEKPTSGQILFRDRPITELKGEHLRRIRRKMQIVFQNPNSSLDPRWRIKDIVLEPLRAFGEVGRDDAEDAAMQALAMVGMPKDSLGRFPHELSGGQKQRIAIARALILNPEFIVLDEPTSALDSSVQAQILNLLRTLQERLGLSYLFITHNVNVVRYLADRIAVMYAGKLVEVGPTREVLEKPQHPYTIALISSVPQPEPDKRINAIQLGGEVPSALHPPSGCRFHPRCNYAEDVCAQSVPELREVTNGHWSACHFAERFVASDKRSNPARESSGS